MAEMLNVWLDDDLAAALERVCAGTGKTRGEIVREALRRALRLADFDILRDQLRPYAEAAGWRTDEDVFRAMS